jgi:hypothetical protein
LTTYGFDDRNQLKLWISDLRLYIQKAEILDFMSFDSYIENLIIFFYLFPGIPLTPSLSPAGRGEG